MNLENMYLWGRKKGINILSMADFTHPLWFREARNILEEVNDGIYKLKDEQKVQDANPAFFQPKADGPLGREKEALGPYFMLSCEVSSIYTENGAGHRIHNLIFAPNFDVAEKINKEFMRHGFNLLSDGRPTFGITTKNLMELLLGIDPKIALIPCHVWTPWFSLYGSRSGYNKIVDCFGDYTKYIFAIETGLSSDPSMNWRIPELHSRSIVSFSDAHSLEKMGREATVLRLKHGISNNQSPISNENPKLKIQNSKTTSSKLSAISLRDITYSNILNGFVRGKERVFEIAYTIEFYPEEGKYHYTGHRNCGVSLSPSETKVKGELCPECHRPLTVGVMHRVEELAQTPENNFTYEKDQNGVVWVKDPKQIRPPFVSLVPLLEILSETLESGVGTLTVTAMFDTLVTHFGSEHEVLFRVPLESIGHVGGKKIAEGIEKVRARNIEIIPGFDGEYGKVALWKEEESPTPSETDSQLGLEF